MRQGRQRSVLHPRGHLLAAVLGQGYAKQTWCVLHTKATTAETHTTEMLPGITESWHRAGIGALDSFA